MTGNKREPSDQRREKLGSLELGRGIAALAVVAHHASLSSDAFTSENHRHVFDFGMLGVDFFFVLSGFIIYHIHGNDAKSFEAAKIFFKKRLRRIYVPYLPISLFLILAYTIFPDLSKGGRDWDLLTSLTLIPTGHPPALSVAWTLVFEMTFYTVFLGAFYFSRQFWQIILLWGVGTILFNVLKPASLSLGAVLDVLLNPMILEFIVGMLMAFLFAKMPTRIWVLPVAVGAALAGSLFLADTGHRLAFGFAIAPIVLGVALAEHHYRFRLPKWVLSVGAASYAIYLVHNPIQSVVARLTQAYDLWALTFAACCLAGVAGGLAYHLVFERPALRLLSHRRHFRQPERN